MNNIRVHNKINDFVYNVDGEYPMILKSTRSISEVNIGLDCTWNTPNFVKYYFAIKNVANFIRIEDEYKTLPGKSHHIFMERVQGMTLSDALHILPLEDIYGIVAQVFMALADTYRKYGFEHDDLHCSNIIVRRLEEPMSITYPKLGMGIKAKYLATLIDYGNSSTHDIKAHEKISMNDIYELYMKILIEMYTNTEHDYKNTLFYKYLVNLAKTGRLEDIDKPIEEWGIWDFYLSPLESDVELPIDDNDLLEQVENIRQLIPQYFITDNIPQYVHIEPIKKTTSSYMSDLKLDVDMLKKLTPNPKGTISHTLYLNGYWDRYANNVAVVLILQNGIVDDYIATARNILKKAKHNNIIDDVYLQFFEDTLGI